MSRNQKERKMRTLLLETGCYDSSSITSILNQKIGKTVDSIRAYGYIAYGSVETLNCKRIGGCY